LHFAPGEMLYDHGQQGAPAWLVLSGSVDITRRDGLDREAPVVTFGRASSPARSTSSPAAQRSPALAPGSKARLRGLSTRRTFER